MPAFNVLPNRARAMYRDLISHPSLISLWTLNEQSTTVYDHCTLTRAHSTSLTSTPTFSATAISGFSGVTFAGAQAINLTDASALNFERTASRTLMVLCRPAATNANRAFIARANASSGAGWYFRHTSGSKLQMVLGNSGADLIYTTGATSLANDTDYLVAATYDGSSLNTGIGLSLNGVAESVTPGGTLTASIVAAGKVPRIGTRDASEFFSGTIALVAVFSAVLTATELRRYARLAGVLA